MPRGIGASTGVNETVTGLPATAVRFWIISGVCRCTPPTPYALADPITSEPSRFGLSERPAPEVPLTATTTTSGSIEARAERGGQREGGHGRVAAGHGDALAPARASRAPGSSGSP